MKKIEKALFSWSSGKDSAMALYEIQRSCRYKITSLLTTITESYDRVSMHGVPRILVEQQAKSLGIPLHKVLIPRECSNEKYQTIMNATLRKFKEEGISNAIFGDIFLEWVKEYRERNLSHIGITPVFPIWGRDTAELAQSFIDLGFKSVITCVDTRVLSQKFLGRIIDTDFLAQLPTKVDPSGENGEFHSFVFDGPIFRNSIDYKLGEQVSRNSYRFCDLVPMKN